MIFRPRTFDEIHASLNARVVARSDLTDMAEGSVLASITGAVAEELEGFEYRAKRAVDAYDFEDAVGADLDERVAQLPGNVVKRLGPSAASGAVLKISRATSVGNLTVPAGTVYGRTDDGSILYIQTGDVVIADTKTFYPQPGDSPVPIVATVLGSRGNAAAGLIEIIVSGPPEITIVQQTEPLSGGVDRETDDELIRRAILWLSALGGTQRAALLFYALSFRSSDGSRIRHAAIYEDPARPGYTELVVDVTVGAKKGVDRAGTVPLTGKPTIYHDAPATEELNSKLIVLNGAGVPVAVNSISHPERGRLFPTTALTGGWTWTVAGYTVWTGVIPELQRALEGDSDDPNGLPGWIAAGCRARVVPPMPEVLRYRINLVVYDGVDLVAARLRASDEVIEYHKNLAPGEPLFIYPLGKAILTLDGVKNITFQATMSDGSPAQTTDAYPSSAQSALRATSATVEIT